MSYLLCLTVPNTQQTLNNCLWIYTELNEAIKKQMKLMYLTRDKAITSGLATHCKHLRILETKTMIPIFPHPRSTNHDLWDGLEHERERETTL